MDKVKAGLEEAERQKLVERVGPKKGVHTKYRLTEAGKSYVEALFRQRGVDLAQVPKDTSAIDFLSVLGLPVIHD